MADITGGMFGDAEYFKPLIDGVHNMSVSCQAARWLIQACAMGVSLLAAW